MFISKSWLFLQNLINQFANVHVKGCKQYIDVYILLIWNSYIVYALSFSDLSYYYERLETVLKSYEQYMYVY